MAFTNPLRRKLRAKEMTYGLWVGTESPSVTEAAVAVGLDWVCIDMEHGHLGFDQVINHLRAVNGSETAAVVRVPGIEMSSIKRALDMGAHGVIFPYAQSLADVERGFQFGRYPPRGIRGMSGDRAVKWGLDAAEYNACANEETLIIPLIETRGAVEDIDSILDIPGLEVIFFGPADMSSSYGYTGEWEGPGVAERILDIRAKADARGISAGVIARDNGEIVMRRDKGFRMVAVGSDVKLMIRAIQEGLAAVGR